MRFILCFLLGLYGLQGYAQQNYTLSISLREQQQLLIKHLSYKHEVKDSLAVYREAEQVIGQLQAKGYLLAEITDLKFTGRTVEIAIHPHHQYTWLRLSAGNLPLSIQQSIGFQEKQYLKTNLNIVQLQKLFETLLNVYENNGYPFASISLNPVVVHQEGLSAALYVQPYQKITFDTIQIVGSGQIGQRYIQTYLDIKKDAPYSEKAVHQIENRLRELPFLTVIKPADVSFSNEKAKIRIYVNKKDASQFDGIVGLQQQGTTGKTQLVGNLKLSLQNVFKRAEQLYFNYQGLGQTSQLLDVRAAVPHILNTAFGLNPSLHLYKQDTSFLNVDTKLGFSYLWKGNNTFQFFIENKSTRLASVEAYQNATTLPPILDANTTFYGLGLNIEKLDYRFNPRKGYSVNFDASVGARKIKRNAAIPEPLYANIPLNTTAYRWFSQASYYVPMAKQLVFALSNQTAFLNGKHLLENEVFRLGGQRSLRGFNELSLLATAYTYGNAEIRYLLEQNSFLFAFYNQALLQYKTSQLNYTDAPMGFGAGVNFETELGILSISYALGKQRNNPLNLRQGKIHFGITALF